MSVKSFQFLSQAYLRLNDKSLAWPLLHLRVLIYSQEKITQCNLKFLVAETVIPPDPLPNTRDHRQTLIFKDKIW